MLSKFCSNSLSSSSTVLFTLPDTIVSIVFSPKGSDSNSGNKLSCIGCCFFDNNISLIDLPFSGFGFAIFDGIPKFPYVLLIFVG